MKLVFIFIKNNFWCYKSFLHITTTEAPAHDKVYKTTELDHPGVAMVMSQGGINLAGPIKVLSDGGFPSQYGDLYMTPNETRAYFKEKSWSTIALENQFFSGSYVFPKDINWRAFSPHVLACFETPKNLV